MTTQQMKEWAKAHQTGLAFAAGVTTGVTASAVVVGVKTGFFKGLMQSVKTSKMNPFNKNEEIEEAVVISER